MRRTRIPALVAILLAGVILATAPSSIEAAATVWVVDTDADDQAISMTACTGNIFTPDCSLRGAIHNAKQSSGSDIIDFGIGISGIHSIFLASPLETIPGGVVFDGTTQKDLGQNCFSKNGRPCVIINGSGVALAN